MRSLKYLLASALFMGIAGLGVSTKAADEKKEEWTIKKIMKFAHDKDEGKLAEAKSGKISDEDKKKLVEAYIALGTLKPEKGDVDEWKKINAPIAAAAKEYGDGKDEKAAKLSKAVSCMPCHKAFR